MRTKEEISQYKKAWEERNKERLRLKRQAYYQEHKEEIKSKTREYRISHSEQKKEYDRVYREEHKEERKKYDFKRCLNGEYKRMHINRYATPEGRAVSLLSSYRRQDRLMGRGECTLTAKWIVDKIFTKRCLYCGESDWHLLGCDRIDNSKPHTPGNVVCSCGKCNNKKARMDFFKYAYSIGAIDSEPLIVKYP